MNNNDMTTSEIPFMVLIAGSRTVTKNSPRYSEQYEKAYNEISKMITRDIKSVAGDRYSIVIVSGGATGVDSIAEDYARRNDYRLIVFPANWKKFGASAGFIRNEEMHQFIAKYPHRVVLCYKDKQSKGKGTSHSIELGKKYNNKVIWNDIDSTKW